MQVTLDSNQVLIGDDEIRDHALLVTPFWQFVGAVVLLAIAVWLYFLIAIGHEVQLWDGAAVLLTIAGFGLFSLTLNKIGCMAGFLVGGGQVMLIVVDKDRETIESYFPQIIGSRIQKRSFQDVVSVGYTRGTVEDEGTSRAVEVRFCSWNSLVLPQALSKAEITVLRLIISTTESRISLRSRASSVPS